MNVRTRRGSRIRCSLQKRQAPRVPVWIFPYMGVYLIRVLFVAPSQVPLVPSVPTSSTTLTTPTTALLHFRRACRITDPPAQSSFQPSMASLTFLFLMLCPYAGAYASTDDVRARPAPPSPISRRGLPSVGFYNPTSGGGDWLTVRFHPVCAAQALRPCPVTSKYKIHIRPGRASLSTSSFLVTHNPRSCRIRSWTAGC